MTIEIDADRQFDFWLDSEGAYLDFAGGFEDGAMELRFDWSWQRSDDGGETWNTLWELEYARVV